MTNRPFIDALTKGRPVINVLAHALADKVASMPSNSLTKEQVPEVAKDMAAVVKSDPTVALVPTKSPLSSKINIAAVLGGGSAVAIAFLAPGTPQQKLEAVTLVAALMGVLIPIFKTYFTNSITPQSKPKD